MVTNAATGFRRKRKVLFSAEDLLYLPDNGRRFELVKGKIYEMAPAGGRHGRAAIVTGALLEWHTKPLGLVVGMVFGAETEYRLARDPDTYAPLMYPLYRLTVYPRRICPTISWNSYPTRWWR